MSMPEPPGRQKIVLVSVVLFGSPMLAAPTAAATSATTALEVSATVAATCSVSTASVAVDAHTGVAATTAKLVIACTNDTPYTIGLSPRNSTGAMAATRPLMSGGTSPDYMLTSGRVHAVNWPGTGTDTVTMIGNGAIQPIIVYSRPSAGQHIAHGADIDTVIATIIW